MKKEYIDFICALHGYMIRVKEIHWNTTNNSEHLLCDEIEDSIHGCEDRFAECVMGMEGKHFRIGDLLPVLPNSESLLPMLRELEDDIKDIKKKTVNDDGLNNILDEMLETCNKYKYRSTQK